jgi:hypothetical protein
MRTIHDIISYAHRAPAGEPLPITDSEVPMVAEFFKWSYRSILHGERSITGHQVIVL